MSEQISSPGAFFVGVHAARHRAQGKIDRVSPDYVARRSTAMNTVSLAPAVVIDSETAEQILGEGTHRKHVLIGIDLTAGILFSIAMVLALYGLDGVLALTRSALALSLLAVAVRAMQSFGTGGLAGMLSAPYAASVFVAIASTTMMHLL